MANFLRTLTALSLLHIANTLRQFPRHSHTHSRTFFYNMKKDSGDLKALSIFYKPKSANQEQYVKYLNDQSIKILFAIGPAGTGKTMLACNQAIKELKTGVVDKIVLTRPVVPVEEEEIGFLPGNINKKMDPWTRPIFDIFNEFYQKRDIDTMLYNNVIEISPLAFMRGRTFKNAFIIADEMQNSSPNQMLMLTTRIGEGSKMVITGDLKQSDRGMDSGLSDFITKYKKYNNFLIRNNTDTEIGIKIVELNSNDIERSKVIKKLLDIYDFKEPAFSKKEEKPEPKLQSDSPQTDNVKVNNINTINNNDAALIPLSHLTRNYSKGDYGVDMGATF
jgi:phosphate starvation-inducible protein PhoH and related proteins